MEHSQDETFALTNPASQCKTKDFSFSICLTIQEGSGTKTKLSKHQTFALTRLMCGDVRTSTSGQNSELVVSRCTSHSMSFVDLLASCMILHSCQPQPDMAMLLLHSVLISP